MEDKINDRIKNMTIQDKARQLTQVNAVYLRSDSKAAITGREQELGISLEDTREIGSVLNFMYGGEMSDIQDQYLHDSQQKIPLAFMMDVTHGYRTIFPVPIAMGATFDAQLVEDCAKMSALEASKNGVQVTFSPMVDLVRDSRWGRVVESTGEDPYLNGELGKAFIRGYHKGGLACCVKHYAAYGAAEAGRDYNTTDMSWHNLREYYLRAYRECLKENPELVMSSFNMLNGKPVNADHKLLVDVLRDEWGFDGVLISDYNAVKEMIPHGYAENEKECACTAANNEIDVEMMSATYIKYLPELVAEGRVKEETVDRMVRRVLRMKEQLGLFQSPYGNADYEEAKKLVLCEEHRKLARTAAEKSLVLLKNDGVLPLKKETKIALAGPLADEQDIIGSWMCFGKPEEAVSVKMGIEQLLNGKVVSVKGCTTERLTDDVSEIPKAVEACRDAEVIVVCIGEASNQSGESTSRVDIAIPYVQIALLKALKELGKPMVSVVFGGRAQILTEVERLSDAILYAWNPGTEGGSAIANVLYGEAVPSGKLPITFPRAVGQCPIYYNHFSTGRPKEKDVLGFTDYNSSYRDELNAPLYPFGYGLSYTTFTCEDMKLSKNVMTDEDTITASIVLKNMGAYDGEEVVQLYLQDCFASMVRPVKELKGYQKVQLKAGEEKEVSFVITEEMLKFYQEDETFDAEDGTFKVMIGNSSDHVLVQEFRYEKRR